MLVWPGYRPTVRSPGTYHAFRIPNLISSSSVVASFQSQVVAEVAVYWGISGPSSAWRMMIGRSGSGRASRPATISRIRLFAYASWSANSLSARNAARLGGASEAPVGGMDVRRVGQQDVGED